MRKIQEEDQSVFDEIKNKKLRDHLTVFYSKCHDKI